MTVKDWLYTAWFAAYIIAMMVVVKYVPGAGTGTWVLVLALWVGGGIAIEKAWARWTDRKQDGRE
jgi:hypothetical protein